MDGTSRDKRLQSMGTRLASAQHPGGPSRSPLRALRILCLGLACLITSCRSLESEPFERLPLNSPEFTQSTGISWIEMKPTRVPTVRVFLQNPGIYAFTLYATPVGRPSPRIPLAQRTVHLSDHADQVVTLESSPRFAGRRDYYLECQFTHTTASPAMFNQILAANW